MEESETQRQTITDKLASVFVCLDIICRHPEIQPKLSPDLQFKILDQILKCNYKDIEKTFAIKLPILLKRSLFLHLQEIATVPENLLAQAKPTLAKILECDSECLANIKLTMQKQHGIKRLAYEHLLYDGLSNFAKQSNIDLGLGNSEGYDSHYSPTSYSQEYSPYGYGYGPYGYGYGYGPYGYGYGYGPYGYGYGYGPYGYGYGYGPYGYGYGYGHLEGEYKDNNESHSSESIKTLHPAINHKPLNTKYIDIADNNSLKLHQYLNKGIKNANGDVIRLKENKYLTPSEVNSIFYNANKMQGTSDTDRLFRSLAHQSADINTFNKLDIIKFKK